jgi:hypothetical protein
MIFKPIDGIDDKDGWPGAKAMLSNVNFINYLKDYAKDETKISSVAPSSINKVKGILQESEPEIVRLANISQACIGLHLWVAAMLKYWEANRSVVPLRAKLKAMTEKL